MEKQLYSVGDRADKFCVECSEERGHIVTSVTKRGQVSRVRCPKCETTGTFKANRSALVSRNKDGAGAPYDRTRTYRAGQALMHPTFGAGEVTAIIEPQKIDVLFSDRVRRLVHAVAA